MLMFTLRPFSLEHKLLRLCLCLYLRRSEDWGLEREKRDGSSSQKSTGNKCKKCEETRGYLKVIIFLFIVFCGVELEDNQKRRI